MEVTLTKTDKKFAFVADNGELQFDVCASPSLEEGNVGFRLMQLILEGVAGCMAIDILQILYKQRQKVDSFRVRVIGDRVDPIPQVFKAIQLVVEVEGEVDDKKLQRAISLSEDKYCSVHKMIEPTVDISTTYTINHGA